MRSVHLLLSAATLGVVLLAGDTRANAPKGRYTSVTDAANNVAVTDTKTGLTWTQGDSQPGGGVALADAESLCATLAANGGVWRVPTMKELLTLVDFTKTSPPFIDATYFPTTLAGTHAAPYYYWTSTPEAGTPGSAWVVEFATPSTSTLDVTSNGNIVRCVR